METTTIILEIINNTILSTPLFESSENVTQKIIPSYNGSDGGIISGNGSTDIIGQQFHNNNNTMNNKTSIDKLIENGFVQGTFCILYTSIFILGIFGNVLVCYVVLRNKAMQTVTNLFITNLALSDILLCVLAVPFTPLYTFLGGWVFGTGLCHLVPYAQGCSIYISTLTLTSIAIDRFFVIIYPFHPRMKMSTCILIVISIWVISLLITLPYGLYVKIIESNETGSPNVYCEEDWPDEDYRQVFGSVTSLLQFVLPFLIISICYICVSVKLNNRANTRPGSRNSRREEADRDRKKRTNKMLIAMVGIFGISWLPLNVVNISNDFYSRSNDWIYYTFLFFISHCVAMSSTCYNPFLYAWLNENFRKEFKQVLPCFNPSSSINGSIKTGKGRLKLLRICNGNTDTVQDTLVATSTTRVNNVEIIPRGPIIDGEIRLSPKKTVKTIDNAVLSSEPKLRNKLEKQETIVLPSGVLETPFDTAILPPSYEPIESINREYLKEPADQIDFHSALL